MRLRTIGGSPYGAVPAAITRLSLCTCFHARVGGVEHAAVPRGRGAASARARAGPLRHQVGRQVRLVPGLPVADARQRRAGMERVGEAAAVAASGSLHEVREGCGVGAPGAGAGRRTSGRRPRPTWARDWSVSRTCRPVRGRTANRGVEPLPAVRRDRPDRAGRAGAARARRRDLRPAAGQAHHAGAERSRRGRYQTRVVRSLERREVHDARAPARGRSAGADEVRAISASARRGAPADPAPHPRARAAAHREHAERRGERAEQDEREREAHAAAAAGRARRRRRLRRPAAARRRRRAASAAAAAPLAPAACSSIRPRAPPRRALAGGRRGRGRAAVRPEPVQRRARSVAPRTLARCRRHRSFARPRAPAWPVAAGGPIAAGAGHDLEVLLDAGVAGRSDDLPRPGRARRAATSAQEQARDDERTRFTLRLYGAARGPADAACQRRRPDSVSAGHGASRRRNASRCPPSGWATRLPAIAAWLLGFVPVTVLAFQGGGYDAVVRSQVGIAVWWILALGCLVGAITPGAAVPPRAHRRRAARRAGRLELDRHRDAPRARSGRSARSRGSRPTSACSCSACSTLDRRRAPAVLLGVASAIALVAGLAVLSRLQPGLFPANETGAFLPIAQHRLNWPLNYWNGLAALCALGIPLAARARRRPPQRRRPGARRRRAAGPRAVHQPDRLARRDRRRRARRRACSSSPRRSGRSSLASLGVGRRSPARSSIAAAAQRGPRPRGPARAPPRCSRATS